MKNLGFVKSYIGTLDIPNGRVDVTDPTYNDINGLVLDRKLLQRAVVTVQPGKYDCFVYHSPGYNGHCQIWELAIIKTDDNDTAEKIDNDKWRMLKIGVESKFIGIDSGMAGFFVDKPNFTKEQWATIQKRANTSCSPEGCTLAYSLDNELLHGFWTTSNGASNSCPVYAITIGSGRTRSITALKIRLF